MINQDVPSADSLENSDASGSAATHSILSNRQLKGFTLIVYLTQQITVLYPGILGCFVM